MSPSLPNTLTPSRPSPQSIKLAGATALGVGGMMGAGLFSLLGLAGQHAGNQIATAFLLGAFAAAFSIYSYARLGAAFPGSGGPANFTVAGFGPGWLSGSLNIFQYLAYLVAAALYAAGFAEYANALADESLPAWATKFCAVTVVIIFSLINLLGTRTVGRAASLAMVLRSSHSWFFRSPAYPRLQRHISPFRHMIGTAFSLQPGFCM